MVQHRVRTDPQRTQLGRAKMRKRMNPRSVALAVSGALVLLRAPSATAADDWSLRLSSDQVDRAEVAQDSSGDAAEPTTRGTLPDERAAVETPEPSASPFFFGLTYTLYTDYVSRGANLSEYAGEGREKLNHQLSFDIGVDVALLLGEASGSWGTFSFNSWFEWFVAQKRLDPVQGGQNLQEADYNLTWSYEVESLATTCTFTYSFLTLPNAKGVNSMEWKVGFEHDDAWMWKWLWADNEDAVLSPFFTFYHDVDQLAGASWIECGFRHDFSIRENLTVTPCVTFGIDHRYLDRMAGTGFTGSTRLAYIQYGLGLGYDLSRVISLPDNVGSVVLSGFLYFNDAVGHPENSQTIQDELFGGVSIGWSF